MDASRCGTAPTVTKSAGMAERDIITAGRSDKYGQVYVERVGNTGFSDPDEPIALLRAQDKYAEHVLAVYKALVDADPEVPAEQKQSVAEQVARFQAFGGQRRTPGTPPQGGRCTCRGSDYPSGRLCGFCLAAETPQTEATECQGAPGGEHVGRVHRPVRPDGNPAVAVHVKRPTVMASYEATEATVERAARAICDEGINTLDGKLATWEQHADGFRSLARAALTAAQGGEGRG